MIVLVRHGETDWNSERRFQGHADTPLNAVGRAQAGTLACGLATEQFTALYTSPLRRASETARIIGGALGLDPVESDALKEVDVGSWSGLTVAEVQERFPDGFSRWIDWRCEGWEDGEQYDDFRRRVAEGLVELGSRHPGERVLAVTQGGPIRAALAAAQRTPRGDAQPSLTRAVANCAVVRFRLASGRLVGDGPLQAPGIASTGNRG